MTADGIATPRSEGFSIGEAAAMVGVSTHVLRSWERRLSLEFNNRTASNQRRYRIDDIHRLMAIRQLHEKAGLPLGESAARALATGGRRPDAPAGMGGAGIEQFWAGLIDTLPEVLLVIDEKGRIAAANATARNTLNVRAGAPFVGLAPVGWRKVYIAIRSRRGHRDRRVLAMRARTGTIFMDARVESVGRPDGPKVLIGRSLSEAGPSAMAAGWTTETNG